MDDMVSQDPVAYARDVVGRDPMATFLGVVVEEVWQGYARCSLLVKPEYLNAVNRAHGATVYAVADQAFAVACNCLGTKALAVNLNVTYTAAANPGETIAAEATPINLGRKVSVWKIEVKGGDGRLIANCQGIAYHK
jgi:acyl-CoA thioesterase